MNLGFSQTWSDPIMISKLGSNDSPDFKIDKNGVIHCVWVQWINSEHNKIFYSKSINNGETWTEALPITDNYSSNPHIVADTFGNLFVSYDYDILHNPRICYVKFSIIDSAWSKQTTLASGMYNRIVIDHSNRVYFFWFAGTEYYMYMDNNVLSDPILPNAGLTERYYFENVTVDNQNRIFCVGNRTAGSHSHGAYFTCFSGDWGPYVDLSNESFFESGISLNSLGFPSFVWLQAEFDSVSYYTSTYYAESVGDSVRTPVYLAPKTSYPAIVIDMNDQPHIVEGQEVNNGYQLIHRYYFNNSWQEEILDQNKNWYIQNVLISRTSCIYLVYNKVDTIINIQTGGYYAMIGFRKLEITPGLIAQPNLTKLVLFPNPFSDKINFEFVKTNCNAINFSIIDIYGQVVYNERFNCNNLLTNKFAWNGKNSFGKQVANGCYFVQISTGSEVIVKKIIRISR